MSFDEATADARLFLVSFPRSGQHFTQHLIERATGKDDYCLFYSCSVPDCPARDLPTQFRVPCYAGRRIQKNHDFDLALPYARSLRYAVLIRSPLPAIQSWYEWNLRTKGAIDVGGDLRHDCEEAWVAFLDKSLSYWSALVRKWTQHAKRPNCRVFRYEEIVHEPRRMRALINFCAPNADEHMREHAIATQLDALKSREFRAPNSFRYDVPDSLPEHVEDALRLAGYKAVTHA